MNAVQWINADREYELVWKYNQKGNLTRIWEGYRITIFERYRGQFGYSISQCKKVDFSKRTYQTVDEAQTAAMEAAKAIKDMKEKQ